MTGQGDIRTPLRGRSRFAQVSFAILLGLLFVQFLLGMYTNLFVHIPDSHHITAAPLILHILVGEGLLVVGALAVIASATARRLDLVAVAVLALASTLLAYVAGQTFLVADNDAYSYLMAVGFLLSASFGVTGMIRVNSRHDSRAR